MVCGLIHQREFIKVDFHLYNTHAALGKWQKFTEKMKAVLNMLKKYDQRAGMLVLLPSQGK